MLQYQGLYILVTLSTHTVYTKNLTFQNVNYTFVKFAQSSISDNNTSYSLVLSAAKKGPWQ